MNKAKVMIAVPNLGNIHALLTQRLIEWHTMPGKLYEQVALYAPRGVQPHDAARNKCVQVFLESDATHLFFVDSDVVPPFDAIDLLLETEMPIVTGLYPVIWRNPDTEKTERVHAVFSKAVNEAGFGPVFVKDRIEQVDYCGGGCLMIKREVIGMLKNQGHKTLFKWVLDENGLAKHGEDVFFCKLASTYDYRVYAHRDVVCSHAKTIFI